MSSREIESKERTSNHDEPQQNHSRRAAAKKKKEDDPLRSQSDHVRRSSRGGFLRRAFSSKFSHNREKKDESSGKSATRNRRESNARASLSSARRQRHGSMGHGATAAFSPARRYSMGNSNETITAACVPASSSLPQLHRGGEEEEDGKLPAAAAAPMQDVSQVDEMLLEKIVANRHGPSFVRRSSTMGGGDLDDERKMPGAASVAAANRSGEMEERKMPSQPQTASLPRPSSNASLNVSLHNSDDITVEKLVALRHGTSMESATSSATEIASNGSSVTQQATPPAVPGAFSREGRSEVRRSRGQLSSSVHSKPNDNLDAGSRHGARRRQKLPKRANSHGSQQPQAAHSLPPRATSYGGAMNKTPYQLAQSQHATTQDTKTPSPEHGQRMASRHSMNQLGSSGSLHGMASPIGELGDFDSALGTQRQPRRPSGDLLDSSMQNSDDIAVEKLIALRHGPSTSNTASSTAEQPRQPSTPGAFSKEGRSEVRRSRGQLSSSLHSKSNDDLDAGSRHGASRRQRIPRRSNSHGGQKPRASVSPPQRATSYAGAMNNTPSSQLRNNGTGAHNSNPLSLSEHGGAMEMPGLTSSPSRGRRRNTTTATRGSLSQSPNGRRRTSAPSTPSTQNDDEELVMQKILSMSQGGTSNSAGQTNAQPSNAASPPLKRQKTPPQPGAYHREGNKIVARRRASLSSVDDALADRRQDDDEASPGVRQKRFNPRESQLTQISEVNMDASQFEDQQERDSLWLEKMVASRLGPSDTNGNSTSGENSNSTTDSDHARRTTEEDGIDLEKLVAMRHGRPMTRNNQETSADANDNNGGGSAPFRRQITPTMPGAFHRSGGRISRQGKGTLTASATGATPCNDSTAAAAAKMPADSRINSQGRHSRQDRMNKKKLDEHTERKDDSSARHRSGMSVDLEELMVMQHGERILRKRSESDEETFEDDLSSRRNRFRRLGAGDSRLDDSDSGAPGALSMGPSSRTGEARAGPLSKLDEELGEYKASQDLLDSVKRMSAKANMLSKSDLRDLDDSLMGGSASRFGSLGDIGRSGYSLRGGEERDIEEARSDSASQSTHSEHAPADDQGNQPVQDLVEALPVTDDSEEDVFDATPLDLEEIAKREYIALTYRRRVVAAVCMVLSVVAIVAGSLAATGVLSAPSPITQAPTTAPSNSPTSAPTANIVLDLPERTKELILSDLDGAQAMAYQWLLDDPSWQLYSQERLLQRFALAVLYYSTNSAARNQSIWTKDEFWLSYDVHECSWEFRADGDDIQPCGESEDSESYENLLLYSNGLEGSIPEEIYFLTSLERIDLQENGLKGSIPRPTWLEESPNLLPKNLELVALVANHLEGSLPSEIGLFASLEGLYLGSNLITGTIPTELAMATGLVDLAIEKNQISGNIPSEMANLNKLVQLSLGDNQLTGKLSEVFQMARNSSAVAPDDTKRWKSDELFPALVEFDVTGNALSGQIPPELGLSCPSLSKLAMKSNELSGPIPSEIGMSQSLTTIDLAFNRLTVQQLPTELGYLKDLVQFDFKGPETSLGGTLPSELGLLSGIIDLQWNAGDFSGNGGMRLQGTIPTEMGQMVNLTSVDLSGHRLVGPIPSELGEIKGLEKLWLSGNAVMGTAIFGLVGQLPSEFGRLPLKELVLSENSIGGPIPSELAQLSQLESLSLHTNRLSATLPGELRLGMPKLKNLFIYRNFLSGTIPEAWLGSMTSLEHLSFYSNRMQGKIPPEIGLLTALRTFRGDGNYLSATIPSQIGNAKNLTTLVLIASGCTGSLPSQLGELHDSLSYIYLGRNLLTGTIPSTIGRLSNLEALDIPSNGFQGSLPSEIGQMTSLRVLYLYQNFFSGAIPSQIGALGRNMTKIYLLSNSLSSSLPTQMGLLTVLEELSLNQNIFSGPLPSELGRLGELALFSAAENNFGGTISTEFGSLTNLSKFELTTNQIVGSIPSELGRIHTMKEFVVESNQLNQSVPTEFGLLTKLERLRFQSNMLTGMIPSEIGLLTSLVDVSFSSNQMNGTLPFGALVNLTALHQLWLSSNHFGGTVGTELGLLSNLRALSVADTGLTGTVPTQLGYLTNLLLLELQSTSLTGPIPAQLAKLANLIDSLSSVAATLLSGTIPVEICPKFLFDCNQHLCGCSCICSPLIGVDDTESTNLQNDTEMLMTEFGSDAENDSSATGSNSTGEVPGMLVDQSASKGGR